MIHALRENWKLTLALFLSLVLMLGLTSWGSNVRNHRIYCEGEAAAAAGVPPTANPYVGVGHADKWLEGYMNFLRRKNREGK